MSQVKLNWQGDLLFEVEQEGQSYYVDAAAGFGSSGKAVRPKGLMLTALAGCAGMDVVSLLKKMRVAGFDLNIAVDADIQEEHPKIYRTIEMSFRFEGNDIPLKKVRKAVDLSITRYCPVYAILSKTAKIDTKIFVNGKQIELQE